MSECDPESMPVEPTHTHRVPPSVSRRRFLQWSAVAGAVGVTGTIGSTPAFAQGNADSNRDARTGTPIDVAGVAAQRFGPDAAWFAANIPFVDIPDKAIEDTYYYRWRAFKKHLRSTDNGYVITEFAPSVPWEGPNGTISAAVGHQVHEARWLRDRSYAEDNLDWWLGGGGNLRQYTSWIGDAVWADYLASGDRRVPLKHLDALKQNLAAWSTNLDTSKGLYWIAPVNDATEFSTSGLDVGDGWAGDAFRPSFNSYIYGDQTAISNIAALAGDTEAARDYAARAADTKRTVQDSLWNPAVEQFMDRFSKRYPDRYFAFASGPELAGLVPWYFGLPDAEYDLAWKSVLDKDKLAGAHGLRTIGPSSPYYMVQHRTPGQTPGECEWNGPSWPFQTSLVLTGMARLLDSGRQGVVTTDDYVALLHEYAAQQVKDGEPYVAENLDPDTGAWIADFPDRSEDYDHSTFADLVLTGLLGVRPAADDTLRVRPQVPVSWDHFAVQGLPYHGRSVTVVYDRDGSHYRLGTRGLSVWVDGSLAVSGQPVTGADAQLLRTAPLVPAQRTADYAYSTKGLGLPKATASSTAAGIAIGRAIDGRTWFDNRPANCWVSAAGDRHPWFAVQLAGVVDIDAVDISCYDDGGSVRGPRTVHLQCWIGGTWKAVQRISQNPPRPAGGTTQRVTFRSVRTDRVRLLLKPQVPGLSVGLTELQILGPRGQRIHPTVPGVPAGAHLYEAESAEVTDAHIVAKGVWSSGGYVGNINNPDSSVVFQRVHADTAGRYILGVRYADGLNTPATHQLTVNGAAAGTVAYAPTGGWGDAGGWAVTHATVTLQPGDNVIGLSKGDGFAELDFIFVQPVV